MQKKKCVQCGKNFESKRSDSIYCSNTCKQKAHQLRTLDNKPTTDKVVTTKRFFVDEYKETKCELPFITYCFIRRSICEESTVEQIVDYLNIFGDSNLSWSELNESLIKTKAFNEFNEKFLSNEFEVYPNRILIN